MKDKTLLEKINKNLATVSSFGRRSNPRLLGRTSIAGSFSSLNKEIKYLISL